jgi:hypothetical protein
MMEMDEFEYLACNEEEAVGVISIHNSDGGGVLNLRRTYCNFFIKKRIECGADFRILAREVARRTGAYSGSITILNIMYF